MEKSNGILVEYYDYTEPPTLPGTFSYGDTIVISIPDPDSRLKTTHTLPNGDVINIG